MIVERKLSRRGFLEALTLISASSAAAIFTQRKPETAFAEGGPYGNSRVSIPETTANRIIPQEKIDSPRFEHAASLFEPLGVRLELIADSKFSLEQELAIKGLIFPNGTPYGNALIFYFKKGHKTGEIRPGSFLRTILDKPIETGEAYPAEWHLYFSKTYEDGQNGLTRAHTAEAAEVLLNHFKKHLTKNNFVEKSQQKTEPEEREKQIPTQEKKVSLTFEILEGESANPFYKELKRQGFNVLTLTSSKIPEENAPKKEWEKWGTELVKVLADEGFILEREGQKHLLTNSIVLIAGKEGKKLQVLDNIMLSETFANTGMLEPLEDYLNKVFSRGSGKLDERLGMVWNIINYRLSIQRNEVAKTETLKEETFSQAREEKAGDNKNLEQVKNEEIGHIFIAPPKPKNQPLGLSAKKAGVLFGALSAASFFITRPGVRLLGALGGFLRKEETLEEHSTQEPVGWSINPEKEFAQVPMFAQHIPTREEITQRNKKALFNGNLTGSASQSIAILKNALDVSKNFNLKTEKETQQTEQTRLWTYPNWQEVKDGLGLVKTPPQQFKAFIERFNLSDMGDKEVRRVAKRMLKSFEGRKNKQSLFHRNKNFEEFSQGLYWAQRAEELASQGRLEMAKLMLLKADEARLKMNAQSFVQEYRKSWTETVNLDLQQATYKYSQRPVKEEVLETSKVVFSENGNLSKNVVASSPEKDNLRQALIAHMNELVINNNLSLGRPLEPYQDELLAQAYALLESQETDKLMEAHEKMAKAASIQQNRREAQKALEDHLIVRTALKKRLSENPRIEDSTLEQLLSQHIATARALQNLATLYLEALPKILKGEDSQIEGELEQANRQLKMLVAQSLAKRPNSPKDYINVITLLNEAVEKVRNIDRKLTEIYANGHLNPAREQVLV